MNNQDYMKQALIEAEYAAKKGEVPIGAVLLRNGEIMTRAHNTREESKNPLAHAEMLLLQQAGQKASNWRLKDTTLYVTVEPCPMCLGALFQARVKRLVFGCLDPKRGGDDPFPSLASRTRLKANNHELSVQGGILAEECSLLLKNFFNEKREVKKIGGR